MRSGMDISPLAQSQASAGPPGVPSGPTTVPHPLTLGAGRSDPFAQYPINMDIRTHELFDHLHGNTCPMFNTLRKIGFFRAILDEAAFSQILSTSSSHMMSLRDPEKAENPEAIVLSSEAIRSINRRITDPVLGTSDGVIFAIISFACHAVMFNDVQGTLTHFNGLEAIIHRRGGLDALGSNPVLRIVLFWIDVNTAFLHDRCPRFPAPEDILPKANIEVLALHSPHPMLEACIDEQVVSVMSELLVLNQLILSELAVRDMWDDGVFAGLHIVPIMSKLLCIRQEPCEHGPVFARQKACRIGALLYLAAIRRSFGVHLAPDIHIPKLKHAITTWVELNMDGTNPLILWLLVIGGAQSLGHQDNGWFVSATVNIIVRLQLSAWEELMNSVRSVLWVEGILQVECSEFHRKISSEATNNEIAQVNSQFISRNDSFTANLPPKAHS
ncbi:hypothetical protein G7Y89_g11305 [Cudoniella acicularis]|uniref:Uncharacterized protein n=1 Tax=Cudoniella acicularis TaxID=354080 RepID=A0A8H4RDD3_9HELO|nr:hypothetical protein G7Y89_g11305 [Cudoniella acicularis]